MIDYIKSILPRIQHYSKQLNDEANFVDIPWGFLDHDGHKVTYIFRRSGELLVSKQGEVISGRWEYLPVIQSILIEYEGRKRMYNQGFLDKGVMILRMDGTDELFPLANITIVPDLNITSHLKTITEWIGSWERVFDKNRPSIRKKIEGTGQEVVLWAVPNSKYVSEDLRNISEATYAKSNRPLPSGEYVLSDGVNIKVNYGRVERISTTTEQVFTIIIILLLSFITIALAYMYLVNS